ncbi:SRPBCC family protein [Arthrobacter castelli]|uniref:SRPBCC family protein n=1 Tax=Arthrobacter castelli TaxID=271431 RepID=UPI000416990E|nr:SRPBCC family protein [Arthrobacter castelli]
MRDLINELTAVHRQVAREAQDGDEIVRVTMRRRYSTDAPDLWAALTEPERIARWFMPVSGDLREGGSFQLEGNADGEILRCDPPSQLRTTFGGAESVLTLTLTPGDDGQTELRLDHTVPLAMAQNVAGALFVGPGWDGAFLGLCLYVAGEAEGDPREVAESPEVVEFNIAAIDRWSAVADQAGAAPEEIAQGRAMALAQFAPGTAEAAEAAGNA